MSNGLNPDLLKQFDQIILNTQEQLEALKRVEETHSGAFSKNEKTGMIEELQWNVGVNKKNFIINLITILNNAQETINMISGRNTSNMLALKVMQICVKIFDDAIEKMVCGNENTIRLLEEIENYKDKTISEINNYYAKSRIFRTKKYELKSLERTLNSSINDKINRHLENYRGIANVIGNIKAALEKEDIFRLANRYIQVQKNKNANFETKKLASFQAAVRNSVKLQGINVCAPAAGGTRKARNNRRFTRKYHK